MSHAEDQYYVPHGSHWPIVGSIGLLFLMLGVSTWLNGADAGFWVMLTGVAVLVVMLIGWFGTVIGENQGGLYNVQVDKSFRMGMFWFIFSEVMFFAAFFGALFYARNMSVPWLGGSSNNFFTNLLLWQGYEATWPTNGPGEVGGDFEVMGPMGLPLINTAILLTSSVTVTIAHHALIAGKRSILTTFLALTFILGFIFVYMQAAEYIEAYEHMNLKLTTGIYGSTFFMLTGFHGMHVTLGAIMLAVVWLRVVKGHFTPDKHFAFEAAAWYWHFVDAVWVGLYVFVYWM
ncbi:MAG: cytochrome c oxidase subunit 3 [Gammaproteobacteria bacterium]|nr:cytochrome c oxidase subunit 3 [Gammaproteobacteria bacterium]MDH3409381.1 cytochrome c oxidase subunit 3 [Gammaproteobacteria bacterium]MDH3552205.1 cytochrome c oxidase subunit 3 [Gammaproteobacteria bacterium]